jgi:hypothetical protein
MRVIWPAKKAEYFCAKGWITQISLIFLGKLTFWRNGPDVIPGLAGRAPEIHFTTEHAARWILRCAIAHLRSRQERAPE